MMSVWEAAAAVQGDYAGRDFRFTGVSTDSRSAGPGDLFVALVGERFDAHNFIGEAKNRGAAAALVSCEFSPERAGTDLPLIRVKDTRHGLGKLAAHWRTRFSLPVAAVTGSNGKTTVKEMIAAILRHAIGGEKQADTPDSILVTEGNLNNDIGMPLMLLRLREWHHHAVVEMGMNHPGEISYLTRLAKPDIAVITNAGVAHLEGLGSIEAVARAKGEIFEGLNLAGIAVINADDEYAALWRALAGDRSRIEFGLRAGADVTARYELDFFGARLMMNLPDGIEETELRVPGVHNVRNALAAAAVASAMGIGKAEIACGLNQFGGVKGRMQKKRALHGATLIDDTYNANPESVRAAIDVLAIAPGKKIFVLGDMGELGDGAATLHERIGAESRSAGIDKLFALGELSRYSVASFGRGARHCASMEELIPEVAALLAPGVTLLVKGSRFMKMERLVKSVES
jgi:UDP-N-acetylmuramoyl-tripeptide--D-alanyl-D-alanine ligase